MAVSTLTAREMEVLHAVVQVGTVSVDDWDKVAEIANMKTGKYARDTWAGARKKLNAPAPKGGKGDDGAADGENTTPKSKGKPKSTPRKRKADDVNGEEDEETPVKKTPKSKASKKSVKEEVLVKEEPNEAGELMDDLIG